MKVVNKVKNMVTTKADMLIDEALDIASINIKKKFGKEFIFINENNYDLIPLITDKFIKKYDRNFERRSQRIMKDNPVIMNSKFIMILDMHTFCYVATGNKIGNVEERFLMNNSISATDMYLYIFGKKAYKYSKELEAIVSEIICNSDLGIFNVTSSVNRYGKDYTDNSESLEVIFTKFSPRSLDTMYFSHREKEYVCNHIDKFISNKDFYTRRQLLYKTGILLYGIPGTGKSSFVKAIASTYNRSICNINMSKLSSIDLNQLTASINVDNTREYIILLEDIDTVFTSLDRENNKDKDQLAIVNKLLQFLDSNSSPNNVIFMATTNHIDKLDEALLRAGRFDIKVNIQPLEREDAVEFGKSFELDEYVVEDILDDYANKNPDIKASVLKYGYNQSKLQAMFLANITNKSVEETAAIFGDTSEE